MGAIIPKLRQSAKGQECTFRIPGVCNHDSSTTVLCHIRDDDKGLGNKANDWSGAFGCSECHEAIDQHRLEIVSEAWYCLKALQRTWKFWRDAGLIVIAGDNEKPRKPSSKTVPRRPMTVTP